LAKKCAPPLGQQTWQHAMAQQHPSFNNKEGFQPTVLAVLEKRARPVFARRRSSAQKSTMKAGCCAFPRGGIVAASPRGILRPKTKNWGGAREG